MDCPGCDGSGTDPVVVYPDKSGYYATRNIEGFREGTEDYKYLMLLRGKVNDSTLKALAQNLLHSTNPIQVDAIRTQLLDLLEQTY